MSSPCRLVENELQDHNIWMSMPRLVENELKDRRIWVVAGLLSYKMNHRSDSHEHYLEKHWKDSIQVGKMGGMRGVVRSNLRHVKEVFLKK